MRLLPMNSPRQRKRRQGLLLAGLLASGVASGARPPLPLKMGVPAITTRELWPIPLGSPTGFDTASRAEIAIYVAALAADDQHPAAPGSPVETWKRRVRPQLVAAFAAACRTCAAGPCSLLCPAAPPATWAQLTDFVAGALAHLPTDLAAWKADATAFHQRYLAEQLRLAALFPRVTSEILPLSDAERLGDDLPDKTFLLTFDDGPTPPGGTTDQTLALLRSQNQDAVFFLLGTALETRQSQTSDAALRTLYSGMCVGSHGQEHRSHAHWKEAATALTTYNRRLATVLPPGQPRLRLFRPPFGERTPQLLATLADARLTDMLWNIDSQDWQVNLPPAGIAGRVLTLMLLKRHGILLFHDVHPKALAALPTIWKATARSGLRWLDCRDLDS